MTDEKLYQAQQAIEKTMNFIRRTCRFTAHLRDEMHAGKKSETILTGENNYIGLMAECWFGLRYCLPVDFTNKPGGDGGVDFRVGGRTIDVKGVSRETSLSYVWFPEPKRKHADVAVFVRYNLTFDWCVEMGWMSVDYIMENYNSQPSLNDKLARRIEVNDLLPLSDLEGWLPELTDGRCL